MTYEQLVDFVQNRMRMSHVYQPVMLLALLRGGGRRSTADIARSILLHDESQVEYYENVTKNMVGRVLKGHSIVEREDNGYSLVGYEDLGDEISPANAKLPSPTSVLFPPSTTGSLQLTGVA
jgi:ATP adenylyltransferase